MLALPWLLVCAIYDLRSRTVPAWLTIPPLILAIARTAENGNWPIVLLSISLITMDDLPWRARGFLGSLQGFLLILAWHGSGLPGLALGVTLLVIWLVWKLGAIGGADAQVLMALALFFQPGILVPVAIAGGIQGLIQWLRKKPTLPAMLAIFAGTLFHLFLSH